MSKLSEYYERAEGSSLFLDSVYTDTSLCSCLHRLEEDKCSPDVVLKGITPPFEVGIGHKWSWDVPQPLGMRTRGRLAITRKMLREWNSKWIGYGQSSGRTQWSFDSGDRFGIKRDGGKVTNYDTNPFAYNVETAEGFTTKFAGTEFGYTTSLQTRLVARSSLDDLDEIVTEIIDSLTGDQFCSSSWVGNTSTTGESSDLTSEAQNGNDTSFISSTEGKGAFIVTRSPNNFVPHAGVFDSNQKNTFVLFTPHETITNLLPENISIRKSDTVVQIGSDKFSPLYVDIGISFIVANRVTKNALTNMLKIGRRTDHDTGVASGLIKVVSESDDKES